MTREEIKKAMRDTKREVVIKNLHKLLSLVEGYPEYEDCVSYAITELEQESALDKIRAEIETWHKEGTNWSDIRLMNIENIIDKYKKSEE